MKEKISRSTKSEKIDMILEHPERIQENELIPNLSINVIIIHRSLWAVTLKDNELLYKVFYYNNLKKIRKEIELLNIMGQIQVELIVNDNTDFIYSRAPYLKMSDIDENCSGEWLYLKLKYWLDKWKTEKNFIEKVDSLWEIQTLPYMVKVLEHYLPNSEIYIDYLKTTKGVQFIHGDFSLSNVKLFENEVIILDFENADIGPVLWDEESFVYSLIENGYYSLAKQLFEKLGCSIQGVSCIAAIKLATAYKKNVKINERRKAFEYITNECWR